MALLKPFQLAISAELIKKYSGKMPFHQFFAEECKLHKNWGGKDRKTYRKACYAYFRLGYAVKNMTVENAIVFALEHLENNINEPEIDETIFLNKELISHTVNYNEWLVNLKHAKPVFLCIVKGHSFKVKTWLAENEIPYTEINSTAYKVDANAKCNALIENGWAWIMDISSQAVADRVNVSVNNQVWDCCSGSGGKALFLTNKYQEIILTCSDARFSIVENLKKRFKSTHLPMPEIEISDLKNPFHLPTKYDIVLADVPCSGSGTWGRTPENITRFNLDEIKFYSDLQKTIVSNAVKSLKTGGKLYYATCSVFSAENELNVRFFEEKLGVKLIKQQILNTNGIESDWLFIAELERL